MLDALIRFSLQQRMLVAAMACLVTAVGVWQSLQLPIDVFPDLNRPRVVLLTEAPGMAPEEVETLITMPLETAMNGAGGVEHVRSSSGVGISVVYVEFAWGTSLMADRQVVAERLQAVRDRLPPGITPQLAPAASIMGQILLLAMWNDNPAVTPMQLRTSADWILRQRLQAIPGVSQVIVMGGERRQFQVLANPALMQRFGVTLEQLEAAAAAAGGSGTGGYVDQQNSEELLVRVTGRVRDADDIRGTVVAMQGDRAVTIGDVADVREGAQVRRGDSSAFVRGSESAAALPTESSPNDSTLALQQQWSGGPAVMLTITKQPGADTRDVTAKVLQAVSQLQGSLPAGTRIESAYSQKSFIDRAIGNVSDALRDGIILVIIILFLFLMNLRITFITLTAIPLSVLITALIFAACGISINTMTLGGLAVAIGELVDDAIVDVENIFRRLRENRLRDTPAPVLQVIYSASVEVRSSIVYSTMIVVLVFVPLFALDGMEGRMFAPLGAAYIVSILASLLVSLTVTPVLSYWLLGNTRQLTEHDSAFLRLLRRPAESIIRFSLRHPALNLSVTAAVTAIAAVMAVGLDRDFLPPFNEGTVQLNVLLPPGTSLSASVEINQRVELALKSDPDVISFNRRTGRAEQDEHAEGVHASEYLLELDPQSPRNREEQLEDIRERLAEVPGIVSAVEQPISHLISHMLSGVRAQIGIRIFGDDVDQLRKEAEKMQQVLAGVSGVRDLMLEPQIRIPQLQLQPDRQKLQSYGLTAAGVSNYVETALQGQVVGEVLEGQRTIDLVVRLQDAQREDPQALERLPIQLPGGGTIPLSAVARVARADGPNVVNRDNVRRRALLQCNVSGRGLVEVVEDMQRALQPLIQQLPAGYSVEFGGQFESQRSAAAKMLVLSLVSLIAVFLLLCSMFRSVNLALQVLAALPMAFIGAVAALVLTDQNLTVAAMVGFISLGGIASRNGILLLNHYVHLVRHEGEQFTEAMVVRAGLERLAPVLMTALTAGIALVPLVVAGHQPGREILYPVATVILGGVASSTLLDFFVHPALFWVAGRQAAERAIHEAGNAQETLR
jgi:HME family heavy-metal exporter